VIAHTDDPRLDELLLRWEELREQGQSFSAEELCSTCPELAGELARRIALLHQFDPLLADTRNNPGEPNRLGSGSAGGATRETATAQAEYRELRFHAAGALGEVFLARNAELNREVALKFLKPSRSRDPDSLRRFLREAEITSRLEHPGVVPIYALGTDQGGAPCYAMRFVRGETFQGAVDAFHAADRPGRDPTERSLALRELLNRFVSICSTVGYAHSRGILHRDLKPRNMMLGKYDETLVVDWGLAKPFDRGGDSSLDEEALTPSSGSGGSGSETPTVGVVGTLAYMSPEQATARWDLMGPASDLFSLGAILYAILTGRAPYQGGAVGESLERVKRCEFPRPRQVKPGIPIALEAVCLKAMAATPAERYATALELAADVRRWLADESVTAYAEPLTVRARRWMRRHRTLVTSTAAVLVFGLAVLAGFTTVLASKNRELDDKNVAMGEKNQELDQQRRRAEQRETLAIDAVRKFHDTIQTNAELKNRPELDALRKALLKEPLDFFRALRDQLQSNRDTRPDALAKLASANFDLAVTTAEIGSFPDAIRSYTESLTIRSRLVRDEPSVIQYQIDLALTHNNLAKLLNATGNPVEALKSYQSALAIREPLAHNDPTAAVYQKDLAQVHNDMAAVLRDKGDPVGALACWQQAILIREALTVAHPDVHQYQSDLAMSYNNIGVLLGETGPPAEALKSHRRALAIRDKLVRDHPDIIAYQTELALSHYNIGFLLIAEDRLAEALESFQQASRIQEPLARDHPAVTLMQMDLSLSYNNCGIVFHNMERFDEALESYQRALNIVERLARDHDTVTEYRSVLAHGYNNIGVVRNTTGRPAEALESHRRALELRERLVRDNPSSPDFQSELGLTLNNLAEIDMGRGRWRAAREGLEKALEHQRKALAAVPGHPFYRGFLRDALLNMVKVHQAMNQPTEAIQVARDLAALTRAEPRDLYKVASALSSSVPLVRGEPQNALAAEAVRTLNEAIAAGWNDAGKTSRDPALAPLRDREDFRRLLIELFDRGFPSDPFAK
jgi:serine/threonine protein kinase